jgi:hypothetical protein
MTDAPLEVVAIPAARVVEPPPVKRGRGRPPGAKNKPKKKTSAAFDAARAVARVGTQFKPGHGSASPGLMRSYADGRSRKAKWREEKNDLKHSYINKERFLALLQNAYEIAMDVSQLATDRLRATEFLIERVDGKATSKVDIDVQQEQVLSLDDKVALFKQLTGLTKPQQPPPLALPDADRPTSVLGGGGVDRVGVPAAPAAVDQRQEEVLDCPQAGAVRVDVLPLVEDGEEAARALSRPDAPADPRGVRLEEPQDLLGVHGVSEEMGDGA